MKNRDWEKIKKDLENGIYKMIRLVQIVEGNPEVLVTYNKFTNKGDLLHRFNYIRNKVESLKPGDYQIQLRVSPTNTNLIDTVSFSIKPKTTLVLNDNGVEDKTNEQQQDMQIDIDDHIKLIHENAELRAQNGLLQAEIELYKRELKFYQDNRQPGAALQDPAEKSTTEIITNVIGDGLTTLMPIIQEHFNVQNRRLDLEEKKLNTKTSKRKIMPKKSLEDTANDLADELEELEEANPDEFERRLDELEEKNPQLYNMVCELLGIEEEEEEEEEGGE